MTSTHYFAYGSDMSFRQIRQRLLDAEIILDDDCRSAARLKGYELRFAKTTPHHPLVGLASIHACAGAVVEGILYQLPPKALVILDACEGVAEGFYQRIALPVESESLGSIQAQVYLPAEGQIADGLKPSRNHLYRLLAAEKLLSVEYFAKLKHTECLKVAVDEDGLPYGPGTPVPAHKPNKKHLSE
jgi:cation transport regulator ChaC